MSVYIISLLSGVLAGVLAGLCGVGGGIVMVPAFVILLRMEQKMAVATSLAVIILTSLVATVRNTGNQLVDWKVAVAAAAASSVVVWFASEWLRKLSNQTLTRLFAAFMIIMGLYMLIRSFTAPPARTTPTPVAHKPENPR